MYQASGYCFSGIRFRFLFPGEDTKELFSVYEEFYAQFSAADVTVEFACVENISEVPGKLIYKDDIQRVILYENTIYRYLGNYRFLRSDSNKKTAVYCQQYSLYDKGHYVTEMLRRRKGTGLTGRFLFKCAGLPHILTDFRRVILHSSFLAYKGKAILFTAPSGTGKSTQAELWRVHRPGAEIVNGDRCVLSCDGEQPYAHGIPLCGTSGITKNRSMPVRAIIVLRQGAENRIRRLGAREAFTMLFSECSVALWSREDTGTVTDLLTGIISSVPVYLYTCRPDASAVDDLEAALDLAQ